VQRRGDRKLRHDARLVVEPIRKSTFDVAPFEIAFREIDEEFAVPRLGFAQVRVEGREFRFGAALSKGRCDQAEALAAARFGDAADEQSIEEVVVAPAADPLQQRVEVGILAVTRQRQASILDESMDLLEVVELFPSELDHEAHELPAIGIVGDQRNCVRGRLALAGRVVEQEVVEAVEDDVMHVLDIVEKPAPADAPSDLAVIGRYVLPPAIFSAIDATPPGVGGEIQITDAIGRLVAEQPKHGSVHGVVFTEGRYDIGQKLDFLRANLELALARDDLRPGLEAIIDDLTARRSK